MIVPSWPAPNGTKEEATLLSRVQKERRARATEGRRGADQRSERANEHELPRNVVVQQLLGTFESRRVHLVAANCRDRA